MKPDDVSKGGRNTVGGGLIANLDPACMYPEGSSVSKIMESYYTHRAATVANG
jgi:hypothetical protein